MLQSIMFWLRECLMLVNSHFSMPCATWASKDVIRGPSDSIISLMLIPCHAPPATPNALRTSVSPGQTQHGLTLHNKRALQDFRYFVSNHGKLALFLFIFTNRSVFEYVLERLALSILQYTVIRLLSLTITHGFKLPRSHFTIVRFIQVST